jgi:hypothetical protein
LRVESGVVYEIPTTCQNKQACIFESLVNFKKMCISTTSNKHFLKHFHDYCLYSKEDRLDSNLIYLGTVLDIFKEAQKCLEGKFNEREIKAQLCKLFYTTSGVKYESSTRTNRRSV